MNFNDKNKDFSSKLAPKHLILPLIILHGLMDFVNLCVSIGLIILITQFFQTPQIWSFFVVAVVISIAITLLFFVVKVFLCNN